MASFVGAERAQFWRGPVGEFGASMGDDRLKTGRRKGVNLDMEAGFR